MIENKVSNILNKARKEGYAIPAVNYIDVEMLKAFLNVAKETNKPLIIAFAEKHLEYLDFDEAFYLAKFYINKYNVDNVILHLDHGENIGLIKKAIVLGFDSVMIDASSKNFDENVRLTKEIVDYAHSKNIFVEAEIGHVGSAEVIGVSCSDTENDNTTYTSVEEAIKFVELTKTDSLAISIGTSHGNYKGIPNINFDRLKEIKEKVNIPLVLHGGSSSGDENLKKCAKNGISKINIYTDFLNVAQEITSNKFNYYENKENIRKAIENKLKLLLEVFETKE